MVFISVPFKAVSRKMGPTRWKIGPTDLLTMCNKDAFFAKFQPRVMNLEQGPSQKLV